MSDLEYEAVAAYFRAGPPMSEHDYDGHGGCVSGCRACRIAYLEAVTRTGQQKDGCPWCELVRADKIASQTSSKPPAEGSSLHAATRSEGLAGNTLSDDTLREMAEEHMRLADTRPKLWVDEFIDFARAVQARQQEGR